MSDSNGTAFAAALLALCAAAPAFAEKGWIVLTATNAENFDQVWITVQPAGRYEIINFRIHDLTLKKSWTLNKDFAIPFEVRAGEITYLGEFRATGVRAKALIGHYIEKPYFLISDQQVRDLPLAVEDFPVLKGLPVRAEFPRAELQRTGWFRVTRARDKL